MSLRRYLLRAFIAWIVGSTVLYFVAAHNWHYVK